MRVKSLGKNITEIEFNRSKIYVLVSYQTPVAIISPLGDSAKTNQFHSITTTRHINQWFISHGYNPDTIESIHQSYFNDILDYR